MLQLLTERPFHSIRLKASNTKDRLCALFYKTLAYVNPSLNQYAFYYSHKIERRTIALSLYPNEIIQFSSNQLYPGKRVEVPPPPISNENAFEIKEDIQKGKLTELCLGMCIDHMRRVKSSKQPFWDTIQELGRKFENGSTKKGFIYQHIFSQIRLKQKYINEKILFILKRLVKTNSNGELEKEVWEQNKEKIRIECIKNKLYPKLYNFIPSNFKLISHEMDKPLLPGDYMLDIHNKEQKGHVINLYHRDEGTVVFDPNYGILFFNEDKKLNAFIASTVFRLFGNEEASINLYFCKNREPSSC